MNEIEAAKNVDSSLRARIETLEKAGVNLSERQMNVVRNEIVIKVEEILKGYNLINFKNNFEINNNKINNNNQINENDRATTKNNTAPDFVLYHKNKDGVVKSEPIGNKDKPKGDSESPKSSDGERSTEKYFSDSRSAGYSNDEPSLTPSFSVFGWNARSASKEQNIYCINKFLDEKNPDFLLLNECGKFSKKIESSVKQYSSVHYGASLAAFYRKEISVTPIWKEMWGNHIIILKVTLEKKSMILLNVYRSPSREEDSGYISSVIEWIGDTLTLPF